MSDSFSFIIRDGHKSDLPACLELDCHYETQYVWRMSFQPDSGERCVTFNTERLPRDMAVEYPISEWRLRLALPATQCFLVAVGRDDPRTLGFLTMRQDFTHRIALVQDVVVSRPFRRRRIGTRLLRVARQWAQERNLNQFMVETQTKNYPGIQFCQRAGLVFCGFNDQYFDNQDIAVFFGQPLR